MYLKIAVVTRGVYDVLFAIYVCAASILNAGESFHASGWHLAVDGLLAIGIAIAARGDARARWLVAPIVVDALARLGVGAVVLAYPHLEDRILSAAVFFTTTIVLCISLGLFGLIYAIAGKRMIKEHWPGTGWPLVLLSVCTLAFGIGLAFGLSTDDGRRALVASNALVTGLTLLACGISLSRHVRP